MTCARPKLQLLFVFSLCLPAACNGDNAGGGSAGKTPGVSRPAASNEGLKSCQGLAGPCSTSLAALPLTGCAVSDYAANVTLGARSFSLIVDSGSGTLGVAGDACSNCGAVSPLYTPGATATSAGTPVSAQYGGDTGWEGVTYRDTVSLGAGVPSVDLSFGAITQQVMNAAGRGFFAKSYCSGKAEGPLTQGILGLSSSGLALEGTDAYLDALQANGKLADAFSFQSCDVDGNLWFGGYDPRSVVAAPQFTPMDSSHGYFLVTLSDMLVDGESLGLSARGAGTTLVDTGTSIMAASPAIVNALAKKLEANDAFQKYIGSGLFSSTVSCTPAANKAGKAELDAALPPLQFKFPAANGTGSITVTLPPTESYLSPGLAPDGGLCFYPGILPGSANDTRAVTIMGNSVMHSQVVIFDRANGQLGFAPQAGCK